MKTSILSALSSYSLPLLLGAFSILALGGATAAIAAPEKIVKPVALEWSYEGEDNPSTWPGLCQDGHMQSPITLIPAALADMEEISFNFEQAPFTALRDKKGMVLTFPKGQKIQAESIIYTLKTARLHMPGEHRTEETEYPLEIQLYFESHQGKKAGVSVFVEDGQANSTISTILKAAQKDPKIVEEKNRNVINLNGLLPKSRGFYRYMGSLTVPPCSEGVNWFVLSEPVHASKEQLSTLQSLLSESGNRPLQQIKNRLILQAP